jgi:regulator of protease activity HflC (stomatin/prohibitin superfamily)
MMMDLALYLSMLTAISLSLFLLSRIKLVPSKKTGLIIRRRQFYRPISPGVHFVVPFVERMVLYDVHRKLSLNREIIEVDDEPRMSISLLVEYDVIDEKDFHDAQVDQFMRNMIVEVTKKYIMNYGTQSISEQKFALQARIKGAILEKVVEWGIRLNSIDLLNALAIQERFLAS